MSYVALNGMSGFAITETQRKFLICVYRCSSAVEFGVKHKIGTG